MKQKKCPQCKKIHSYHHGDLKHAIILASLEIMSQSGLHALSLRAAAKQAGVSPSAPYRHFPNKAALLASLAAFGFNSIANALQQEAEHHPDNLMRQLLDAAIAYIQFAQNHPALFRMMFTIPPQDYPELEAAHTQSETMFIQLIQQAQKEGVLKGGDPQHYATVAFSFVHGLSLMMLEKHHCQDHFPCGLTMEEGVRQLCRIMWNGFGKHPIEDGVSLL